MDCMTFQGYLKFLTFLEYLNFHIIGIFDIFDIPGIIDILDIPGIFGILHIPGIFDIYDMLLYLFDFLVIVWCLLFLDSICFILSKTSSIASAHHMLLSKHCRRLNVLTVFQDQRWIPNVFVDRGFWRWNFVFGLSEKIEKIPGRLLTFVIFGCSISSVSGSSATGSFLRWVSVATT